MYIHPKQIRTGSLFVVAALCALCTLLPQQSPAQCPANDGCPHIPWEVRHRLVNLDGKCFVHVLYKIRCCQERVQISVLDMWAPEPYEIDCVPCDPLDFFLMSEIDSLVNEDLIRYGSVFYNCSIQPVVQFDVFKPKCHRPVWRNVNGGGGPTGGVAYRGFDSCDDQVCCHKQFDVTMQQGFAILISLRDGFPKSDPGDCWYDYIPPCLNGCN